MKNEHVISDEVVDSVITAISNNHTWLVYNTLAYFLDKVDVLFFKTEKEADEFAFENNCKTAAYRTIQIHSLIDLYNQIHYGTKLEKLINQPKNIFMNLDNLNYLKDNLKFMGFGDKLQADLEKNIQQGFPEFVLKMDSQFSGKTMDSVLHFRRSDESEMYFFNRHDARLKNDVGVIEQSFYLNKGHGVTLKEAFNLLEGRSVHKVINPKEGESYQAWIQLDFKEKIQDGNYKVKQFHENYGYDLASTLRQYPIKELQGEQQRERLMMSLQRGNVQSVTMVTNGREQMFFIEANPQFKTINIYNAQMKSLDRDQKSELLHLPEARQHVNGKEVKTDQPGVKKGTTNQQSSSNSKEMETVKPRNEKKKQSQAETSAENKTKTNKSKSAKNLLPQKEGNRTTKGLRV
jgi:hypothetical protein